MLRKELENIIEHEGEECLCEARFVDDHPIVYWNLVRIASNSSKYHRYCCLQRCQPLRFERNYYDILLPLRLLRYMSRSLRQRRIPNSPKNSCCKRLKQAVAANRVISENKTCTLLNILPPLDIHISSFPLTSSLCVAGWPNFGGSAYCVGDWLTSHRVF